AVVCGDGVCIEFTEVQPEGGKRMPTDAFLRGKKLAEGAVLGGR
ncbi:MAG: methionyl-tRNA formyltransferase, partial [Oscillospiraceae bacterium]|nr:methionyl-tRNA formyltransferase [Oscillospiraceae bacterium]